jgi:hypothetical protein
MILVDFAIGREREPAADRLAEIGLGFAVGVIGTDHDSDGRPVVRWLIATTDRGWADGWFAEVLSNPVPGLVLAKITTPAFPTNEPKAGIVWFDALIGSHTTAQWPAAATLDLILSHGERFAVSAIDHLFRRM